VCGVCVCCVWFVCVFCVGIYHDWILLRDVNNVVDTRFSTRCTKKIWEII